MKILIAGTTEQVAHHMIAAQRAGIEVVGTCRWKEWLSGDSDHAAEFGQLLKHDSEALVLCGSPDSQLRLAREACAAGKDVLLVLPVIIDGDELDSIYADFSRAGRRLTLVDVEQYLADRLTVRSLVEHQELGQVGMIEMKKVSNLKGRLRQDVVSLVNQLIRWTGAVKACFGFFRESNQTGFAVLTLALASGALACLEALNSPNEPEDCRYELCFSGGTIRFDGAASYAYRLHSSEAPALHSPPAGPDQDPLVRMYVDLKGDEAGFLNVNSAMHWRMVHRIAAACAEEAGA